MIAPVSLDTIASVCNLRRHGTGDLADVRVSGLAIDSRAISANDLFVAMAGSRVDGHDFIPQARAQGASAALVERPVDDPLPQLVASNIEHALAGFGRLARSDFDGVLVGVTGSAGKTTAKNMIAAVLGQAGPTVATEGNLNNELGVPLTLATLQPGTEFAVVELGAGKPGDIAWLRDIARPDIALLLNIAPAHLEYFGTLDAIAETKGALLEDLPPDGVAIINGDEPWADAWRKRAAPRRVITFGRDRHNDYVLTKQTARGLAGCDLVIGTPTRTIELRVAIPGNAGAMNALAAATVADLLGMSVKATQRGFDCVTPGAGRGRSHALPDKVTLVDDTYNANPASVRSAIDLLAESTGETLLILGSMLELGDREIALHQEVGRYANTRGINGLWTVGNLAAHAADAFGEDGRRFDSLADAVTARNALPVGATVLVKGSRGAGLDALVSAWAGEVIEC